MLKEASISDLHKKGIPKDKRVLVNRGRGNDELAPSDTLFRDFTEKKNRLEKELGKGSAEAHNRAFLDCDYERRFREQVTQNPEALAKLKGLAGRSRKEDVYLVCYEGPAKACHRRILLRMAEESFGTQVVVDGVEPTQKLFGTRSRK
jgi:uncharacterized protein YeaO (DUF488 family)